MSQTTVILDIETTAVPESLAMAALALNLAPRGNLTDPVKIQRDLAVKKADLLEDAALSPWTGRVVAIGYHVVGDNVTECLVDLENERQLLEDFAHVWESWRSEAGPLVVTFCGRKFDLPFLAARMAVQGLECRLPIRRPEGFKYHLDLKEDLMKDFKGGLNIAALAILGRGKVEDLDQLQEWIKEGNWEGVRAYCLNDVALTAEIYRKYERML